MRITIITVVLNDALGLQRTIQSVINQNHDNIEYIIVDGGSSDNTVGVIRKYDKFISSWISEKDCGLYHAMNKGILLSNSEYICFMNAGDIFFSDDIVSQVNLIIEGKEPDIVYGDAVVSYSGGFSRIVKAKQLTYLWKGMCFSHQAMFIKTAVMENNLYNLNNRLTADYKFVCKLYHNGYSFKYAKMVLVSITADGLSDVHRLESSMGHWRVAREYWPGLKTDIYYGVSAINTAISSMLHQLLPRQVGSFLQRLKYRCCGKRDV